MVDDIYLFSYAVLKTRENFGYLIFRIIVKNNRCGGHFLKNRFSVRLKRLILDLILRDNVIPYPFPAVEFVSGCRLKYIPLNGINFTVPFNSHISPIQLS